MVGVVVRKSDLSGLAPVHPSVITYVRYKASLAEIDIGGQKRDEQ